MTHSIIRPELGDPFLPVYARRLRKFIDQNPDMKGITIYVKNNHWWSWWKRVDNVIDITHESFMVDCGMYKQMWYEFTILKAKGQERKVKYKEINIGGKVRINGEIFNLNYSDDGLIRNNFLTEFTLAGI